MATILNGDKRGRPGRWLVDYRDSAGIRRLITVRTRDEAKAVLERVLGESRQQTMPTVDPNITAGAYAARWLETVAVTLKARSHERYSQNWRQHLAPRFGEQRLRTIQRGAVQSHLVELLKAGKDRGTVRLIHSVLRSMLNAAIGEGIISTNPADKVGRALKLTESPGARQDEISIKALDRAQAAALIAATEPKHRALILLMARTGLRIGEVIGLEWTDVDIEGRQITVSRNTSKGVTDTPKSGHGRSVDMSDHLAEALRALLVDRKALTLRRGWGAVPARVFITDQGETLTEDRIRAAMARALKAAKLPLHHTPHSLRHTFASLHLQAGESVAYVQRQFGHASIKLTVDTYGKWLPMGKKAAANRLDELPSGSKMVAAGSGGPVITSEIPAIVDGGETASTTTRSAIRLCPRARAASPSPAISTTRSGPTSSTWPSPASSAPRSGPSRSYSRAAAAPSSTPRRSRASSPTSRSALTTRPRPG
jgi:integrase